MEGDDNFDTDILKEPEVQYRPIPYTPFRQPTFTSKSGYKKFQIFKLALGFIILVPIRIILMLTTLITAIPIAALYLYKAPTFCYPNPADVNESNVLVVIVNRLTRLMLFALGLTSIEFKGKVPVDYDQDRAWLEHSVVAAPHSGTFDWSLIVARATRLLSPMIRSEANNGNSGVQRLIRLTMPIVVDRFSKESRQAAVKDCTMRMKEGFSKGWFPVVTFPEGTNGNRKQLMPFKPGPFIAGEPVIPVVMSYPQDEQTDNNDLVTWPHFGRSVPMSLLLAMCRLQTTIVYTFLEKYVPTEEEKMNPALFAENVRQVMSKEAKMKTCDWTFDDAKLMRQCQRAKLQPEIGAIKVHKVYAGIKNGPKYAEDLLTTYIKILQKYMCLSERNNLDGLLPVVRKETLLKELSDVPDIYEKRLPNYVSFEQLAVLHSKLLTQKLN